MCDDLVCLFGQTTDPPSIGYNYPLCSEVRFFYQRAAARA